MKARARLRPEGPPLPARTYRVRAHADPAYRSQVQGWEDRVRQQLAWASEVTAGPFGVTFQLVEARPWGPAPPSGPLRALLESLEALDPGQDVDLVLGYTSSLPAAASAQHELGLARVLGRHAVLRAVTSEEEQTAVLLHHWGHTLGAHHSPDGLMHDDLAPDQGDFSPESAAVISIGLRQKGPGLDDPEVRAAWAKALAAWLDSEEGKALDEGARKFLAELVAAGGEPGAVMGRADHEVMRKAIQQDHEARYSEASETLRPLLERHPDHPRLHAVACQVQIHAGASDDAAWKLCERAAELDPEGPSAPLFLADMADRRKDGAAAREALARARSALERMKGAPAGHWAYLAALHRQRLEVSAVDSALEHAGEGQAIADLRDWALRTRRWVGLVPGTVPPEREGEYVAEFQQVQLDLEQGRHERASRRIAALEKAFAGAVGPLTLRCELRLRQGARPRGLEDCRRALERYADSVHARYILGLGFSLAHDWREAAAALERVVELDPTLPDAWSRLSYALRAQGDARGAEALRERYRRRFGRPPPFR